MKCWSGRLMTRMLDTRRQLWCDDPTPWLSSAEQEEYAACRHTRRRREWLGGRWLLKDAVQQVLAIDHSQTESDVDLAESRESRGVDSTAVAPCRRSGHRGHMAVQSCDIEVLSRDARGRWRAPRVLLAGRLMSWHVSLAHQGSIAWAAISTDPNVRVGIDVVPADPINFRGRDLWFTSTERHWLQQSDDPLLEQTLWAVKEAVFKATNHGEPFVPARIRVLRNAAGGLTWSRDEIPRGDNDSLRIHRCAESIVVLTTVCREPRHV